MDLYLNFATLPLRHHIHNLKRWRLDAFMTAMGAFRGVLYLATLLEDKATRLTEGGVHDQALLMMCHDALDVLYFV